MEGQMSEKKGPFDTDFKGIIKNLSWPWYVWVIEELRQEYLCTDKDGKSICLLEKCEDYKSCVGKPFIQAIRVLEAAGKVNKKSSIRELDAMYKSRIVDLTEHSRGGNIQFDFSLELKETADINYQLIRALLESLPEPEQKKE